MSDVLDRDTKEYLRSVNTAKYSDPPWLINPDLTAVEGWPSKYWLIEPFPGTAVSLMDQAQRDNVDAAEDAGRTAESRQLAQDLSSAPGAPGMELRQAIDVLNQQINAIITNLEPATRGTMPLVAKTRDEILAEYDAGIAAGDADI